MSTDSSGKHAPRNGVARALLEADPNTPVSEIPELLEDVDRWVCSGCSKDYLTRPERCGKCGTAAFTREPANRGDDEP